MGRGSSDCTEGVLCLATVLLTGWQGALLSALFRLEQVAQCLSLHLPWSEVGEQRGTGYYVMGVPQKRGTASQLVTCSRLP